MRFLKIPQGKGYWASIFFLMGLIVGVCAGAFLIANIIFSAFGIMQFSGGQIIWNYSGIMFPTFTIVSGGKIGLLLALFGGILASASQIRLWIVPSKGTKTISERKGLFLLLSLGFVIYDLLSTFYFLNGGMFYDGSAGWINGLGNMVLGILVAASLFSVGPIIFLVWGIETTIENHKEGIPSVAEGIKVVVSGIVRAFTGITKAFEWELEETKEKVEEVTDTGRRRGRPSKSDYETVEDMSS